MEAWVVQLIFYFIILLKLCEAYYDYGCKEPLLNNAVISATSAMAGRGPKNARIDDGNAWSAANSDFEQYLTLNLKNVMNITGIATQGRENSIEYVQEYTISYGSNGLDFSDYKEVDGSAKLFVGNTNGNTVKENTFDTPIIAQWIRINPTRWRDRISMRVELYGCGYEADTLYFNGTALVKQDLTNNPISTKRDSIRFRFKTNNANGVIIYSRSTQGDYIALQLVDNKMWLNIDLGSRTKTSMTVGSLLDDSIWHDVQISRDQRNLIFTVDRVMIKGKVKGDFPTLNLNREFYIGGVPNQQEGLDVIQNFTGCIENMYLGHVNVINAVKNPDYADVKYEKVNTIYSCPDSPIVPVTFLTRESHAKLIGYEDMKSMNVSVDFRTYETGGLLISHKFTSKGAVNLYLDHGKVKVLIDTENNPRVLLDNYERTFNDGQWHRVMLTIDTNSVVLQVDNRPMRTTRILNIRTGYNYFIGGGVPDFSGFIGCMRQINVDGNYRLPLDWKSEEYCCKGQMIFDACQMVDRCNPNPCEHGGICRQSSEEFYCDCAHTDYSGATCHTALSPLSCQSYRNGNPGSQSAEIKIDVDGSGPLKPFQVSCDFFTDGRTVTQLHHLNQESTLVDGFEAPGSFVQDIIYDGGMEQIEAFINQSYVCKQSLRYECYRARLLNSPVSENGVYRPFSWWVSRYNQKMDYWSGSLPGSFKCECGILGQCVDVTKWCNCDSGLDSRLSDNGEITDMQSLPVRQLRFGDTGTPLDDKKGWYTLGPLVCEGDALNDNVVTFRITDASINFPTFDMGHSGDIYFEFKTTIYNAVLFHSKGPIDFIKVSIISGTQMQFTYQAGSGPLGVSVETSYKLNDNEWHTVSIERNRKEARILIDGALKSEVREPPGPVRALHLTSDFVVGSAVDYRDGYVGCIRSLMLNGKMMDLKGEAMKGLYGVGVGCTGRCDSNPCLNNGTCTEGYDHYTCDCRWSSFKGPICADEIGVNLRTNSMVVFDFLGNYKSTISEKIRIGFTTTEPKGFLMGLYSNISKEYLTLAVSNSGHLRLVFDFGFERQELVYPDKHFATGQYHDVRILRADSGSKIIMRVDDDNEVIYPFNIKASADAQFNNIQYLYIGKNETMREGFIGCVSRVEFDDIYPLKYLFQEDRPTNIRSEPSGLGEDFCGIEPVTHPPDTIEQKPAPELDEDKLQRIYQSADSAILGGVLAIVFLAAVIIAVIVGRFVARHKGEYLTQEDKGAIGTPDPDEAVMHGTTGHQVHKKKEWFI